MNSRQQKPALLKSFILAFPGLGEGEALAAIKAHWDKAGAFTSPSMLYDALMDMCVERQSISPEVASVLKRLFAESFYPEYTTGYFAKHRAPLINGLAQLYSDTHANHGQDSSDPTAALYRVKIDVANLGGLNTAVQNRKVADDIIGIIAGLLENNLGHIGKLVPVRSGGDELEIILTPNNPANALHIKDDIEKELIRTQHIIDDFIVRGSISGILHPKYKHDVGRAGVNIGFSVAPVRGSTLAQTLLAEKEIAQSKYLWKQVVEDKDRPLHPLELEETHEATDFYHLYMPHRRKLTPLTLPNDDLHKSSMLEPLPEQARLKKYRLLAAHTKGGELSPSEHAALQAMHALTERVDHVTGLPMFTDMQADLLPHILMHGGRKKGTKLIHFDFSNMAGGNLIGEWIGDAMGRRYAEIVKLVLQEANLEKYIPYLASQGGGKFAVLVPGDTSEHHLARMQDSVQTSLQMNFQLDLTQEEAKAARNVFVSNEGLRNLYTNTGMLNRITERLDNTPPSICLKHIVNPKTKHPGTLFSIAMSKKRIDPDRSIYQTVKPLETAARKAQEPTPEEMRAYILRYVQFRLARDSGVDMQFFDLTSTQIYERPRQQQDRYYINYNGAPLSPHQVQHMWEVVKSIGLEYVINPDDRRIAIMPYQAKVYQKAIDAIRLDDEFIAEFNAKKDRILPAPPTWAERVTAPIRQNGNSPISGRGGVS